MAEENQNELQKTNEDATKQLSGVEEKSDLMEDNDTMGSIADFPEFDESAKKGFVSDDKLDFLKDLQLNIYIELGRTKMLIKDLLELERGYVIELEKLASEPVDVFVNNKKIAEGEVVVIDKHFGIRIINLVDTSERLKGLKK